MTTTIVTFLILIIAVLYSTVGHGGASGYLAIMALAGVDSAVMKPVALVLNILVAGIATLRFARAGAFSWRLFWPFAATSIPLAFLGGTLTLPDHYYKPLVGLVLLYSAWRSLKTSPVANASQNHPPAIGLALIAGAALGLLSGITGVGGGIFLSPLILLRHWADAKTVAAVAAPFIVVNSISGLAGLLSQGATLPAELTWWLPAAAIGALLGAELGSKRLGLPTLQRGLAVVLVIAGVKLLFLL